MNKIIPALILGVILGVGLSPAMAETAQEYEKIIADKNAIIMEQIKVIMELQQNYKKTYAPFSLENFPETDGFNPEWLQDEKSKIIDTCNEAKSMGYTLNYCQFVQ